jgi:hypothetical protein
VADVVLVALGRKFDVQSGDPASLRPKPLDKGVTDAAPAAGDDDDLV